MNRPTLLLLPFVAAFVFALGNILQKRAFKEGAGILSAFVLNNLLLGLAFLPFLAVAPRTIPLHLVWQPLLAGGFFYLGSISGLLALRYGDVSLVTPLLGTKVILVALVSVLVFHVPLRAGQSMAAALTTAGVLVMGITDVHPTRRFGVTTGLATLCSLCFAICDTLIQQWAAPFGIQTFVPLLFGTLAVLSSLVIVWQGRELLRIPRPARKWLGAAGLAIVTQAMLVTFSIALTKDATGVNVVYALRGLWGLALVWVVGHHFGNTEHRDAGTRTLALRLIGALLILGAVLLAVLAASR